MLNQFTLNFINSEERSKYLKWNEQKVVKEHLNSTIYILSFSLINMIQFIVDLNISYIAICGISCAVVIYLHKYITKKPQNIDYVITIYQLFALVVTEIDTFLPQKDQTRSTFKWSYGYQTGFIHFCLYLQGANFIWSTFVLFLVNSAHISLFPFYPTQIASIIASFLFMIICMTGVKYNYEKKKKEEFLNYTQLVQWETIIQKLISNTMILIRFDKAQDQLRLVKQSIKSQQMHQIHDCYGLRSFLRNLIQVKSSKQLKHLDPKYNLERYVRKQLLSQHRKFSNQIYVDQTNNIMYEIKLSKFILNNELQGLLILDAIEASQNQILTTLINLFNEIQMKMSQQLKFQFQQISLQNMDNSKIISPNVIKENFNLQTTLFFLQYILDRRREHGKQQITYSKLSSYLQYIFKDKFNLIISHPFYHKYDNIISILVTCSKLIDYVEGYLPQFTIQFKPINLEETQMIVCFNFSIPQLNQRIYSLLKIHRISYHSRQFDQSKVYENCLGHLRNLKEQYNLPLSLLFDICSMQILLSQICQYNYLQIEQNPLKLLLSCTFYNLK